MNKYWILGLVFLMTCSCNLSKKEWSFYKTIDLGESTPIGMLSLNQTFWLSDGDNNRLIQINKEGKLLNTVDGFERPMHIATDGEKILIPEFGKDQISRYSDQLLTPLFINDSLDAPAGIDYFEGVYAIADFYNHRILIGNQDNWKSIGQEGKAVGDFYYPTDVHLTKDKIYVADAYNNRVQVFDRQGKFLQTFGEEEKMNAATGIYVSESEVLVTDFENNRILVYTLTGELSQIITSNVDKPTDLLLYEGLLYVTNYKGKSLSVFK